MNGLGAISIDYLRVGAREAHFTDGQTVVRRGQPGQAFYVVLSGTVEVFLTEEGKRLPLARLEAGAFFGEMSLLSGEPVSADVAAVGQASLLVCPAERFQAGMSQCEELRRCIVTRLCESVRRTSSQTWMLYQRAETLKMLMAAGPEAGPVVAESVAMKALLEQASAPAVRDAHLLIRGGPGTGKLFLARKLHELTARKDAPLVVVDCARLTQGLGARLLFGSLEDCPGTRTGLPEGALHNFGTLDLADRGSLVLRHVDALEAPAQDMLERYLQAPPDRACPGHLPAAGKQAGAPADRDHPPRVRLVATTCQDLDALAKAGRFNPALAAALNARTLDMPRMSQRKRDVLPLARLFLDQADAASGGPPHRLDRSAEHALLSAQYRHRNAGELRDAVEFAAVFAETEEIRSEHIFTGPRQEAAGLEYDLGKLRAVRRLVEGRGLLVARLGVGAIFVAIVLGCLVGGQGIAGIANGLVWGLWWPGVVLLFFLVGRAWCAVCPLSGAGRMLRPRGVRGLAVPEWIRKHGAWVGAGLFLAVIWSEQVFDMPHRPLPTACLLLALTSAAVICRLAYQRELWCRYACPLGWLGASYSVGATVHVRANPGVCATQCKTHECFKGSASVPGCPVFHHPMYARDGHFCKLCLNCLRNCPHGSARLSLGPPLLGVWRQGDLNATLVPFALIVLPAILVMLASHHVAWAAGPWAFTGLLLLAAGAGTVASRLLPRLLGDRQDDDRSLAAPVVFALLVLAAGPLLAYHLDGIPLLPSLQIRAAAGSPLFSRFPDGQVPMIAVLQLSAILLSALLSAVSFWRLGVRARSQGLKLARWPWRVLAGVCGAYLLSAVALVLMGQLR